MPYIFPSNLIQFNNESLNSEHLMFGESVYLYGENNNLNTKKLIEMLNSCNADVKIYLNISVAEKNKCLIDMLKGVEVLTSNITEDSDYALKVAVMAMERAKRMAEIGKKVILAVDDVLSLVGSENGDMHVSKQIMSLTKNTSNGSVSVFAIMSENKNVCVFEKLADKRLYI